MPKEFGQLNITKNDIDKIKEAYNQIEDHMPYVGDSTIKTLIAASMVEYSKRTGKELAANLYAKALAGEAEDVYRATTIFVPRNFQPFEEVVDAIFAEGSTCHNYIDIYIDCIEYTPVVEIVARVTGVTYRNLVEILGHDLSVIENTVKMSASEEPISLKRAAELYLETIELKKQLQECKSNQ